MTIAQIAAAVSHAAEDGGMWRDIATGLVTVLLGLVGWVCAQVLKWVKKLDEKIDYWSERLTDWNQGFTIAMLDHESRLESLDGKLPARWRRRKGDEP